MSVQRVVGLETEFGILSVEDPGANPMLMSAQIVSAYSVDGVPGGQDTAWDYQDEDPLNDARGFRLDRAAAHPSQLTDAPPPIPPEAERWGTTTLRRRPPEGGRPPIGANLLLPNGGRFYVDHAHPEYSGPETTNPRDALIWDLAGDEIALRASRFLAQYPGMPTIALYKNNTDGKGASYGTHENYLVDRAVPFTDIVALLTPFFITRPIFCGAGRVGLGQRGEEAGFQISQRADFIEAEVGLETTLRRPIINTRDEPHADATRFRRLHVIVGDANLVHTSAFLKVGTTALVLWLLESGADISALTRFRLADPVGAAALVSRDLDLTQLLPLADGGSATALEIQREYWRVISAAVGTAPDTATREVLDRWDQVLSALATDPMSAARTVEWVAKLRILEGLRSRDGLGWDSPKLAALDLQWSDLRPEKGIYHRLARAGAVDLLVSAEEVEAAVGHPPTDTRAYFRGECLRRFRAQIPAANWDALVFDLPGEEHLRRVPMPDPLRGTREHVGELLQQSTDAASLIAALVAD